MSCVLALANGGEYNCIKPAVNCKAAREDVEGDEASSVGSVLSLLLLFNEFRLLFVGDCIEVIWSLLPASSNSSVVGLNASNVSAWLNADKSSIMLWMVVGNGVCWRKQKQKVNKKFYNWN